MKESLKKITRVPLVLRILIGLIVGIILGLTVPGIEFIGVLGKLFISALKAIAPVLVFALITSMVQNPVSFPVALLLCIVSTFAACGASGVAGGSLLLTATAEFREQMKNDGK